MLDTQVDQVSETLRRGPVRAIGTGVFWMLSVVMLLSTTAFGAEAKGASDSPDVLGEWERQYAEFDREIKGKRSAAADAAKVADTTGRPVELITAPHDPDSATAWMAEGNCRLHPPSTFFPSDGVGVDRARKICRDCPVMGTCLEYALEERIEALSRRVGHGRRRGGSCHPPCGGPTEAE